MLAVQRKRAREPTPPPTPIEALDLPSPLDFLRTKRRKSDQPLPPHPSQTPEAQVWQGGDYFTPSRAPLPPLPIVEVDAGVERRRAKAWERRNADPLPPKWGPGPLTALETPAQSSSQNQQVHLSSPPGGMVRGYSEPEASTSRHHMMSSSPIRHQPFDSSPFRERESSGRTRVDPEAEGWDMAEVERTWGQEYANQNSLLYSLHRARRDAASQTPDQTLIQTPMGEGPPAIPGAMYTPSQSMSNIAHLYGDYRDTPPSSTHYTSSSPFPHTRTSSSNPPLVATANGYDDERMEMIQDLVTQHQSEVQQRYEEANRLLGELEVARRQRWGEG